jgi:hypothetical protein
MKKLLSSLALASVLLSLIGCSASSSAKKNAFSQYCDSVSLNVNASAIILNTQNNASQLFFVHNMSKQTVLLNKGNRNMGAANAGWSSDLDAGKWSAINLTKVKNFELVCQKNAAGPNAALNCSKVLFVCHAKNVHYQAAPTSAYWITENQTEKNFIKAIQQRGVAVS